MEGWPIMFQNAKIIASDVKPEDYRNFKPEKRGSKYFVMSRSELMEFALCPHRWLSGVESGDTESTQWGSLVDCLALTPNQFESRYAVAPETYLDAKTGEAKDWNWNANFCKDWRKERGNQIVIKMSLKAAANRAVASLLQSDNAGELLDCSKASVFVTADYCDKATGLIIPVKILLDLVPDLLHPRFHKSLADLKTAVSAKPADFEKAIFNCNYDAQAALYTDIYVAATGEDRCEWLFALQENSEPFEVADPMPALSSEFLDLGRMKYKHALEFYARCLADNHFPSYSAGSRLTVDGRYFSEPSPWMISTAVEWPRVEVGE